MIISDRHMKFVVPWKGNPSEIGTEDFNQGANYYYQNKVQPCSIDLHLDKGFKILSNVTRDVTDLSKKVEYSLIDQDSYTIPANGFVLASTQEWFSLKNNICGIVCGRSSIARRGIQVEIAGLVDPGFRGNITLEIFNQSGFPQTISYGNSIAQIMFNQVVSDVENPYSGKYQNQKGVTESKIEVEYESKPSSSEGDVP